MITFKSLVAAAVVALGALGFSAASQAAGIPNAAGIAGQDNLIQKTHGYHRRWVRGHRHWHRRRHHRWHRRHYRRHHGWHKRRHHRHHRYHRHHRRHYR